jgi:hypothetical protein
MLKDLRLNWVAQDKKDISNVSGKYLEYLLSGQSLRDYLGISNNDSVTPFGWFLNKEAQREALKQLRFQSKSELIDNRVELYICSACGDVACGAVTAKILDKGDRIVWSKFATQSDPYEISEFFDVEDVEFERNNYFKALSQIR